MGPARSQIYGLLYSCLTAVIIQNVELRVIKLNPEEEVHYVPVRSVRGGAQEAFFLMPTTTTTTTKKTTTTTTTTTTTPIPTTTTTPIPTTTPPYPNITSITTTCTTTTVLTTKDANVTLATGVPYTMTLASVPSTAQPELDTLPNTTEADVSDKSTSYQVTVGGNILSGDATRRACGGLTSLKTCCARCRKLNCSSCSCNSVFCSCSSCLNEL